MNLKFQLYRNPVDGRKALSLPKPRAPRVECGKNCVVKSKPKRDEEEEEEERREHDLFMRFSQGEEEGGFSGFKSKWQPPTTPLPSLFRRRIPLAALNLSGQGEGMLGFPSLQTSGLEEKAQDCLEAG